MWITNNRTKPVWFTISTVLGIDFRANGSPVVGYTAITIDPGDTVAIEVIYDCTFMSGILDTAELVFYEDGSKLATGEIYIDIELEE